MRVVHVIITNDGEIGVYLTYEHLEKAMKELEDGSYKVVIVETNQPISECINERM